VVAAGIAVLALVLLHTAITFGVGAATGRSDLAVAAGAVVAVGGYLLHGFAAVAPGLEPLGWLSPWHWYAQRNVVEEGASLPALLGMVLLGALCALAGGVRFTRRDLR
jgi:ABC-2 type transport system permease protein